jgi:fructan beta-fructosidase
MKTPISVKPFFLHRFVSLIAVGCLCAALDTRADEPQREKWRPRFHFTPAMNWTNDPNGMVFYDGEYHLFYQFNPLGPKWGHMSWGHAVSRDLVHWEHLPVALREQKDFMIFSGSAVVDWKNSSGLGKEGKPPLVAIYTAHDTTRPLQNQHLAYSNDRGRTWTRYSGNPVLDIGARDFRDPKVFWHEPTRRWVMVVAWPVHRKVRFYASPNLKDWTHLNDFGPAGSTAGIWECPDLFPVEVENKQGARKWVLIVNVGSGAPAGGSGCQYFVGDFDGMQFTSEAPAGLPPEPALWADWGRDFYAAVSWSDIPARDGRRLWLGWMSNWEYAGDVPTSPWRGAMAIPRALTLRKTDTGWVLLQRPAQELETLRGQREQLALENLSGRADLAKLNNVTTEPFELEAELEPNPNTTFHLKLQTGATEETTLRADVPNRKLTLDRTRSGNVGFHNRFAGTASARLRLIEGRLKLRLFVDASSIEVFINDGEAVVTSLILPSAGDRRLDLRVVQGEVRRTNLRVWKLTAARPVQQGPDQKVLDHTDPVFRTAIAAWHMGSRHDARGKNELRIVGAAAVGIRLEGQELADSLARGGDGFVAWLDGGYLDAGQGAGGVLNPSGKALTVSVRLRSPSGAWDRPLFSKHGGHDRLVYNLYSSASALAFELGTRDTPGMTSVSAPLARIGASAWHDVVCRYDGEVLQMFVDGVLMDEAFPSGPLRVGNTAPCLIGAEPASGGVKAGWRGDIDHVALWDRVLTDAEIVRLAGGAAQVAARRKQYTSDIVQPPAPDLYREALRPQFHFTARQWTYRKLNPGRREEGWLNDPNGLIHLDGEYHLFAQRWNKCWIHAVSADLVHWKELQPAFWEDRRFGTGVQSGNAVLDVNNTSGLAPDRKTPPLVAFWSGNDNKSQCIAYSLDKGRTWTKYAKNPVLVHPERDPMVFWHSPTRRWIMVLYGSGSYLLFTSTNLLNWNKEKESIPDCFECPDLFPLPVDGDRARTKWVLVRGNGKYSVGAFDGRQFTPETPQRPCDFGPNFYATQSWGNIAGQEGRRVQIAWMRSGRYPNMPFNQQMTFPCDLTLRTVNDSLRLFRKPACEIERLHATEHQWRDLTLAAGQTWPVTASGDLFRILAEVEIPEGSTLTLQLRGTPVALTGRTVACKSKPAPVAGGIKTVEILVDRTSIETFVNNGEVSVSTCFLPQGNDLSVACGGGPVRIRALRVIELRSIWK